MSRKVSTDQALTVLSGNAFDPSLWNTKHSVPTVEIIGMIESCLAMAEIDGFINPVAVNSILWLYLAMKLVPEKADEIESMSQSDSGIFGTVDYLQNEGIIAKLCEEHADDVNYAFSLAEAWYRQYVKFVPTFAGQIGKMSFLTEDFVKDALQGVQKILSEGNVDKIMQIAETWGMDNELTKGAE